MIENGLYQQIVTNSAIKTAVGVDANGTTSAYWILAPQGAKIPFLILSRVATTDNYGYGGTVGVRNSLFQVVCYASTYLASRQIASVVRQALQNFTGPLPDGTVVQSLFIEKDFDMSYEEGGKGFVYGAYIQFRVFSEEN